MVRKSGIVAALVLLAVAVAAPAADNAVIGQPKRLADYELPGLQTKIYLDTLTAWDVVQLVEFLAKQAGLSNIVIGQGVAGLTTKLKLADVTAADALEIVLSMNSLAYEVRGGILTIMSDAEYQALRGASFYDQKKIKVFSLKYADAGRVAPLLASIKSSIGTIVPDAATGSLILIDTPEKIAEMVAVAEQTDIPTISRVLPTETRAFRLQYADLTDIENALRELLSKEAGSLRGDPRTRTLIVTDLPHTMEKIVRVIEEFDRRPKQVFIEAKVVEVTLDDRFSLGVNWSQFLEGLQPRFRVGGVSQPGLLVEPVGTLSFNTIVAGEDLQIVMEALQGLTKTKILSNPQIAVVDGQEAVIEVVENQPYKEVQLEAGTTNVTGVTYLFQKVGVQLHVTPRINDAEMINVDIKPEISSISTWYDGPPQEATPVIRRATAETTVMVKNGVTIIIGGMIMDRKDAGTRRVPVFGSIPLIGRLFRNENEITLNTEIVVFLTPRIISGETMFPRQKDLEKDLKPLRSVGLEAPREAKPVR